MVASGKADSGGWLSGCLGTCDSRLSLCTDACGGNESESKQDSPRHEGCSECEPEPQKCQTYCNASGNADSGWLRGCLGDCDWKLSLCTDACGGNVSELKEASPGHEGCSECEPEHQKCQKYCNDMVASGKADSGWLSGCLGDCDFKLSLCADECGGNAGEANHASKEGSLELAQDSQHDVGINDPEQAVKAERLPQLRGTAGR